MSIHHPNSLWTDENVERLKVLWARNGLSAQKIADAIGGGISRHAVIGKAKRLKLESRAQPITSTPEQRAARRARKLRRKHGAGGEVHQVKAAMQRREEKSMEPNISPPLAPLEAAPAYADSRNMRFDELEYGLCKFPTTPHDVGPLEHRFCGQEALPGIPYCGHCAGIAFSANPYRVKQRVW